MSPDAAPAVVDHTDREHLRILVVCHYAVAGIIALFSLIPVVHLILGMAILFGWIEDSSGNGQQVMGGLIVIAIALFMITIWMTLAGLIAWSGRLLARRQRHMFCTVVAGLACMLMPFGTVLGVFTLIVLMRPSVKAAFTS